MLNSKVIVLLVLLTTLASAVDSPPLMWQKQIWGSVTTELVYDDGILYFGTSGKKLYALNASTGEEKFNYTSTAAIYSTPEIHGDFVYFGCDNNLSYALNKTTGKRIWSFLTKNKIQSQPTFSSGKIYFGGNDGNLYILRSDTGKLLDKVYVRNQIKSKTYVGDYKIILPTSGRYLTCLSNITFEPIWNITLKPILTSAPIVSGERVYTASSDGRIYSLDLYTGDVLWNNSINQTSMASPAFDVGRLFVSTIQNKTFCLNASNGETIWDIGLDAPSYSRPVTQEGIVYVSSGTNLKALDEKDGTLIWLIQTQYPLRYPPTIVDTKLYLSDNSYIKAYGALPELTISDVKIEPINPINDRYFTVYLDVENTGTTVASQFKVSIYVDGVNMSEDTISLKPGKTISLKKQLKTAYGRHLLEAYADTKNKTFESNKKDNSVGFIFNTMSEWPTTQLNYFRTGNLALADKFSEKTTRVYWGCTPSDKNISLKNISSLFSSVNASKSIDLSYSINHTCYSAGARGYVNKLFSANWSCRPENISGISPESFYNIKKTYIENRNSTKQIDVELINTSNFMFSFRCGVEPKPDFPLEHGELVVSCRYIKGYNLTYSKMLDMWSCYALYSSNYSVKDLAYSKGYDVENNARQNVTLSDYQLLWNFSSSGFKSKMSSPILVDVYGGDEPGLEIVFGNSDGLVICLDNQGNVIWATSVDGGVNTVSSEDVDDNGETDILVGYNGGMARLDPQGKILWDYKIHADVASEPAVLAKAGVLSKEILFGSKDGKIRALNHKGQLLWDYEAIGEVNSPATLVDIDSDREYEVALGSKDTIVYVMKSPPYKVWAYQTNGEVLAAPTKVNVNSYSQDLLVTSSDGSIYDLYKVSAGVEDYVRVCGPEGCSRQGAAKTKLEARWVAQVSGEIASSPAVGDLGGDGVLDFVVGSTENLCIYNSTGGRILRYTTPSSILSPPSIADLDSDGDLEIIFGSEDGTIYLFSDGEVVYSLKAKAAVNSNPAIADVDFDGTLEFAATSDDGKIYLFGTKKYETSTNVETTHQTTYTFQTSTSTYVQETTTTLSVNNVSDNVYITEEVVSLTKKPKNILLNNDLYRGYCILVLSLMGYYFYMVIAPHSRVTGVSSLKKKPKRKTKSAKRRKK